MGGQLRFMQASDLLLDTPVSGVGLLHASLEDPEIQRLHQLLSNARYRALEKLFQAAVEEQVDFVLLAGNVFGSLTPGSQAPWFIIRQLRTLEQARIPVIWSEDSLPEFCPGLSVPRQTQFLTDSSKQREIFVRMKQGTVRVVRGTSLVDPLAADFTIAIVNSQDVQSTPFSERPGRIDYIAAVGAPRSVNNRVASSGPLQGQGFHQPGEHGCLLVTTLETACETRFLPMDSVRWCHERVSVNSATTWESLEQAMLQRQHELAVNSPVDLAVVKWDLAGYGPLWTEILDPEKQDLLLASLRRESLAGHTSLLVTSLNLTPDPTQIADWQSTPQLAHVFTAFDSWRPLAGNGLDIPAVTGIHDHVPSCAKTLVTDARLENLERNVLCRAAWELLSPHSGHDRAA